jgi:ribonuclease HI
MNELFIYCDGGARGNPGPAAVGVYIIDKDNKEIKKIGKTIGTATNNIAEYSAVVEAFEWLIQNLDSGYQRINFYLDSQLVYSQIVGLFKVKDGNLREKLFKIREKEALVKIPIFYNLIRREKNKEADLLVNKALDNTL